MKKYIYSVFLTLTPFFTGLAAPYTDWQNDYTGTESGTLLLWKFNSPDPSLDSGTGGYNATFSTTGTQTGVTGKFGQAFFSGPDKSTSNDSFARNGASAEVFNTSALSVEFWFQPVMAGVSTGNIAYFVDKKYSSSSHTGVLLALNNTGETPGTLYFEVGNGSSSTSIRTASLEWNVGQWYHIAATYQNVDGDGVLRIFRDGKEEGFREVEAFGSLDAGARFWNLANRLGSSNNSSTPGYYDNFRISSIAYDYAPIPEARTAMLLFLLTPFVFLSRHSTSF